MILISNNINFIDCISVQYTLQEMLLRNTDLHAFGTMHALAIYVSNDSVVQFEFTC